MDCEHDSTALEYSDCVALEIHLVEKEREGGSDGRVFEEAV